MLDDLVEGLGGLDMGHLGSKLAGPALALGVAAGEFAHQVRALLYSEALHDEIVVPQHAIPLFGQTGLGGNGFPRRAAAA